MALRPVVRDCLCSGRIQIGVGRGEVVRLPRELAEEKKRNGVVGFFRMSLGEQLLCAVRFTVLEKEHREQHFGRMRVRRDTAGILKMPQRFVIAALLGANFRELDERVGVFRRRGQCRFAGSGRFGDVTLREQDPSAT